MIRAAIIALLFFVTPVVAAQELFEVVLAGTYAPETCLIVPRVYPALQWFNPDRLELDVEQDSIGAGIRTIASPDHRRVFGLLEDPGVNVVVLSLSGTRTPFFSGLPGTFGFDLSVASSARVFVKYYQSGLPRIAVISSAGVLETTWALPTASFDAGFEVAGDGCTIYYSAAGAIARFDACTGTPLSDFAAVTARDLDLLPDGRVVVTRLATVLLYSAAGVLERTIATVSPLAGAVAVSADGQSLYVEANYECTEPSTLFHLALADGRELSRRPLTMHSVRGIVAGSGHATVPTASETALLAFAITLAIAGVFLLKR